MIDFMEHPVHIENKSENKISALDSTLVRISVNVYCSLQGFY